MTKVILYIATSLDGFIADKDGGVDWLPHPPNDEGDEFGYKALMHRVSTILMGSRSYRQILGFGEWAWGDKTTYVFTSQPLTTTRDDILFVNEDAKRFMEKLKSQNLTQDIWLLGGAELVTSFAKEKLIDECILTVVPSTLGEGIKLKLPLEDYILQEAKKCSYGIEQNHYVRKTG
ncbi:MAG: dihydrofolate reductase family protein [Alphaproteobacteria bacterium]|nr:dihydrofolate reductase family protein [Alphaproteobacteria bacterium]